MSKKCISCGEYKKRFATKKKCSNCYRNFKNRNCPITKLRRTYSAMYQRCTNKNKGFRYLGMKICTRKEFLDKFKKDKNYLKLHRKWIESNREHKLVPSIDRIDNNKGYTIDNIEFLIQKENSIKDRRVPVMVFDYEKIIGIYRSIKYASKQLGLHESGIRNVLNKKYSQTGGYKIERLNDE